jgi:N-acetyl-anhydromuramyl-L-alanine amidase AmpD
MTLGKLCHEIEKSNNREMIYVGHEEIAGSRAVTRGLRKEPKKDPGRLFDWKIFYEELNNIRGRCTRNLPI